MLEHIFIRNIKCTTLGYFKKKNSAIKMPTPNLYISCKERTNYTDIPKNITVRLLL